MHAIEAGRVAQRVKDILDKELGPTANKRDVLMAILATSVAFSKSAKIHEDEFFNMVVMVNKVMRDLPIKKRA